jgi:uncharacterized protein YodC (DUF2158 family)
MKKYLLAAVLVVLSFPGLAQNVGDVVYLKSGGPPMTVTEILPRPDASGTDVGLKWFGGANMMAGTFPASTVVVLDPLPAIQEASNTERCRILLIKDPAAKC